MSEHTQSFTANSAPARLKAALAEPAIATAELYVDPESGWGAVVDPGDGEALLEVIGFDRREQLRSFLENAGIAEILDDQADTRDDEAELGEPDLA